MNTVNHRLYMRVEYTRYMAIVICHGAQFDAIVNLTRHTRNITRRVYTRRCSTCTGSSKWL